MVWPNSKTKVKLIVLIQSVTDTHPRALVAKGGELHKADLPSSHLLSAEFYCWQIKYCSAPLANTPNTLI